MNLVGKSWIREIVWDKNQKEEIIDTQGEKPGRETLAKKLGRLGLSWAETRDVAAHPAVTVPRLGSCRAPRKGWRRMAPLPAHC